MSLRLTRRGRTVLGICTIGFVLAWISGARSLNAIVLPGLLALGAAYVQVSRIDPPAVDRRLPPDDFVGTTHLVELEFKRADDPSGILDRPFIADVRDTAGPGLEGPADPTRVAVGNRPVTYELTYTGRGERKLGPVTMTAVDVFGLLERDLLCRGNQRVVVYPERHPVPGWFRRELYHDEDVGPSQQRNEFDRLREYARGDALRDVHWPTTAKRDELVVKAFAAEAEQRRVHLSGGARGGAADDLATATTSIALTLLDDGIPVTVSLPNGTVECTGGPTDRRRLLELLAFTAAGAVPDPDADVVIEADPRETTVGLRGRRVPFTSLTSQSEGGTETPGWRQEDRPETGEDTADTTRLATDGGSRPTE